MLFETGKPGPGMFVLLSGHVAITQRDGLGHVTPVIDQGPGQFLAEIGQLSGRVALVDGHAEGDVETLLIPPERAARAAGRRGRSRRAHHARADPAPGQSDPGRRRRSGADRAVEFAGVACGCRASSPATAFRIICSIRRGISDAAELIARYSPSPSDWPLVVTADGTVLRNPSENRAGARARHDRRPGAATGSTMSPSSAAVRRGLRPRSMRPPKACRWWCWTRAPSAARPAPARESRTISAFPPAFPARRWPAAPSTRRRSSAPTS